MVKKIKNEKPEMDKGQWVLMGVPEEELRFFDRTKIKIGYKGGNWTIKGKLKDVLERFGVYGDEKSSSNSKR